MPRNRVQVTVTPEMRVALGLLARRSGLLPSTQATVTLRQALDRTIQSVECQDAIKQATAFRTSREWRDDRYDEHAVALAMEQAGER